MAAADGGSGAGVSVPAAAVALTKKGTPRQRRPQVRWSKKLGDRLCARVAGGELLHTVLREPGWPTPQCVATWARQKPAFGHALTEARKASGRFVKGGGGVLTFNEGVAEEIFDRLCGGEGLTEIAADPTMPSARTIFNWRLRFSDFDDGVELGKRVQAERCCDEGLALAAQVTPETAYATHVRLTHMRWATGVMAPRVFRVKAVEPPGEARRVNLVIQNYSAEVHPETGERRMVTWRVNPQTGEVIKTWSESALSGAYKG
jgi:hypothetical protein